VQNPRIAAGMHKSTGGFTLAVNAIAAENQKKRFMQAHLDIPSL
jgi:hypothetical protein